MPPDTPPPDDARRSPSSSPSSEGGGNVVDPAVLAERRAQRAEQAEQSAARRAADAQVLAAQLARERARLEAERDAARAEASAAREGADAAIAEARHLQAERDALRAVLEQARGERDVPADPGGGAAEAASPAGLAEAAPPARPTPVPSADGHEAVPGGWPERLRRELTLARTATPTVPPASGSAAASPGHAPVPGLARERRLVAQRAAGGLAGAARSRALEAQQRRGDRAAPITALTLERERSSRLQAQLDSSLEVQRELRTHIAALQRAVHQRVEAERRIEAALRRVREELTAANALAAGRTAPFAEPAGASALAQPAGAFAPAEPARGFPPAAPAAAATAPPETRPADAPAAPAPTPPVAPAPTTPAGPPRAAAGTAAPSAVPTPPARVPSAAAAPLTPAEAAAAPAPAQTAAAPPAPAQPAVEPASAQAASAPVGLDPSRLTAARERLRAAAPVAEPPSPLPSGPPAPWLTAALQRLLADDPDAAGRLAVGLLPALGLTAQRALRCDLALAGRGTLAVDMDPGTVAVVAPRTAPRPRGKRDLSIAADATGLAKLLHGRRALLRRPARMRGSRSAKRELRRAAQAPLALRDLGAAGVALEPALALRLLALAIDPAATQGERFAVAHAPLGGGPVDAWLRIADGAPPAVVTQPPPEPTRLTLRCTRGALIALIAGVDPAPGESGTLDGDERTLALLRTWIAQTEHPAA